MAGYLFIFWFFSFFIIGFIGLFEIGLSQQFNRFYFRTGIPLYRKRYPFYKTSLDTFSVQILERYFTDYNFKRFDSNECAFRKTIRGKNSGVTHGIIQLSREGNYIIVKGYADWLPLLFFLWLIGFPLTLGVVSWSILYSPFFLLMFLVFGASFISEIITFELIGRRITGRL